MKPLQVVFPSRADPESPIIDLDLHLPLLCFRPEKVLQVCGCQEHCWLDRIKLHFPVQAMASVQHPGVGRLPQALSVNPRTAKKHKTRNPCAQSICALCLERTLAAAHVSVSSLGLGFGKQSGA